MAAVEGLGRGQNKQGVPIEIKIGEAEFVTPCANCGRMKRDGFFVIVANQCAAFLCIQCTGTALVKYQDTHPNEKVFDTDVDVDDGAYAKAAERVRQRVPELSESKALDVVKIVVDSL